MIPLRDSIPSRRYPIMNNLIIAVNVVLFLVESGQAENLNRFIYTYGLVPARYSVPEIASHFTSSEQIISLISFMFLHGSFWHLLGNMWSLYIFGDNIEDRLGSLRYLLFYLLCGWASGLTHLYFNWGSTMPTIGASGAIAGVMGAYFILYPGARILTLIPIIFIPYFVEIPALFFLGLWFVFQFLYAATGSAGSAGIAWWAHIGGFIFGILFLKLFSRVPETGISRSMGQTMLRKTTPRLQFIRSERSPKDLDLEGQIVILPQEALRGTRKMLNIPGNLGERIVTVSIPPGIESGTRLRLAGMGRKYGDSRGDFYLRVIVGGER
jgi:membrane associated rhomboid family serine protease